MPTQRTGTIEGVLQRWDSDEQAGPIRIVPGLDGRPKLQIRVDLGILQLELDGRPDGQTPHTFPSLLDYHLQRLADYRSQLGTDAGFRLTSEDAEALVDEATLYYQRYINLHQLGCHAEVVRDTARNLRVAEFLERCAKHDDSWPLVRYRPFITMVNALAQAEIFAEEFDHTAAQSVLAAAIASIRHFGSTHLGQVEVADLLDTLSARMRSLQADAPRSETDRLERLLDRAIATEDFERAALVRDSLRQLSDADEPPVHLPDSD